MESVACCKEYSFLYCLRGLEGQRKVGNKEAFSVPVHSIVSQGVTTSIVRVSCCVCVYTGMKECERKTF